MDATKIIKDQLIHSMFQFLKEKVNEPITVELKEPDDDLFDLYTSDVTGTISVSEEEMKMMQTPPQKLGSVAFNKDTSYIAFHYYVWKELSLNQKVLSIFWLNMMNADNKGKQEPMILLDGNYPADIGYEFFEEAEDFVIRINPFTLTSKEGFEVLHKVLGVNLDDDLNLAYNDYALMGECKFDKLTLVNHRFRIDEPEAYEKFLSQEKLTQEEIKELLAYAHQPKQQALQKVFETVKEYMNEAQTQIDLQSDDDYLIISDIDWQMYEEEIEEEYENLEKLYHMTYKKDKNQLFEDLLKNQIELFDEEVEGLQKY